MLPPQGSTANFGAISGNGDGRGASSTDSAIPHQAGAPGSGGNSSVSALIYRLGFQLSLLFAGLMLLAVVIWAVIKMARKREPSQNGDVVYKSLQDAREIYGKMIK